MAHHSSSTRCWCPWRRGTLLLLSALLAGSCATVKPETSEEASEPPSTGPDATTPYPIHRIPAGTVVADRPPTGWSNLIFKSRPRVGAGDVDRLGAQARDFNGLLFTAMLANVKSAGAGKGFRLDKIAYGLGTRIGSKDVIITPDTQKRLGANFGFLARMVLDRSSDRMKLTEVAARSDTVVVIDNPAVMLYQGKHRRALLRYALVVDPQTGRLDTFLWGVNRDEEGKNHEMISAIEWLPPSKVQEPVLHVDGAQISRLGVPSETAVALSRVHPGDKHLQPSDELKKLATRDRLSAQDVRELQRQLRALLQSDAER